MTDMIWSHVDDVPAHRYTDDITLRQLWEGPADRKCFVVDLAPGAVWPKLDVHEPGPEEVFVVSGVFNDGVRDYPAGSFIHYPAGSFIHCPAGSSHVPQSATGCRLFVFYPEG